MRSDPQKAKHGFTPCRCYGPTNLPRALGDGVVVKCPHWMDEEPDLLGVTQLLRDKAEPEEGLSVCISSALSHRALLPSRRSPWEPAISLPRAQSDDAQNVATQPEMREIQREHRFTLMIKSRGSGTGSSWMSRPSLPLPPRRD